jgi:hypothetical protein
VSIKILFVLTFSYKPNMLKFMSTEDGQVSLFPEICVAVDYDSLLFDVRYSVDVM